MPTAVEPDSSAVCQARAAALERHPLGVGQRPRPTVLLGLGKLPRRARSERFSEKPRYRFLGFRQAAIGMLFQPLSHGEFETALRHERRAAPALVGGFDPF